MMLSLDEVIELACLSRYSVMDIVEMDSTRQDQIYKLYVTSKEGNDESENAQKDC